MKKRTVLKANIRETSVNKLALFSLLMQEIIAGQKVVSEKASLARKEIKEMLVWLDKKTESPRSVRKQAIDKLKFFENILNQIIGDNPVLIADAEGAMKDIEQITNWLDKRKYCTFL
ncbi:MAG: hypothetical protein KGJ11_00275 [Candidatus Omnitrophica bacterium]|nr:hypothetical protein [Candidatus Omnitrophota bacterium]